MTDADADGAHILHFWWHSSSDISEVIEVGHVYLRNQSLRLAE